jgi:hypothetical protein
MEYRREFEYEEELYVMEFEKGGYNFVLDEPLPVEVLPGRIRGRVKEPIEVALPRYDREMQAYVMPDGQWVTVDRDGTITPRVMPFDFEAPLQAPELLSPIDTTADASETPGVEIGPAMTESGMPSTAPAAIPVTTSVVPVTPSPTP